MNPEFLSNLQRLLNVEKENQELKKENEQLKVQVSKLQDKIKNLESNFVPSSSPSPPRKQAKVTKSSFQTKVSDPELRKN